jgi:hypothetical protein
MFLLLPRKLRVVGYLFTTLGIFLGIVRFYFGIKLKIFDIKVFAVYSKYFETNYFKIISNHFSEELTALLLLIGLFFIAFAKEKSEDNLLDQIRLKSLIITLYINTGFLIFSFLFIYGFVFINILVINLFSPLIIYTLVFNIVRIRSRRTSLNSSNLEL